MSPSHRSLKPPGPGDSDARKDGSEGSGGLGHLPGQVLTDHSKTRHFLNFALLVSFLPDKHPQLQVPGGKPLTLC